MQITVTQYDRRTIICIDKNLKIDIEDIEEFLNDNSIRASVDKIEDLNEDKFQYRVGLRLTVKEQEALNRRLYGLVGLKYKKKQKITSKPKKVQIRDPDIIRGFTGNLITGCEFR